MRRLFMLAALGFGAALVAAPLVAQEKKNKDQDKGTTGHEGQEMDPAMQAMMEAWMKVAAPGKHHEHLKPLAGKWSVANKWRMAPEADWTESKSESEAEWILGGRFLLQKVKGDPMFGAEPFEGLGIMGYDNDLGRYQSVWMDNMGTMLMKFDGSCDESGKTITLKCNFRDAMTKQDTWMKCVYKIISSDKYILELYSPDEQGKEVLGMEMVYTRKR